MEFGNHQQNINIGKRIQFDPINTLKAQIISPGFSRNISQLKHLQSKGLSEILGLLKWTKLRLSQFRKIYVAD